MKFEKVKAGMTLYDVHSYKMGNTTQTTIGVWPVEVVSVDLENRFAIVSWNYNGHQRYSARNIEKLRASEPLLVNSGWGCRLATREEIKAAKIAGVAA